MAPVAAVALFLADFALLAFARFLWLLLLLVFFLAGSAVLAFARFRGSCCCRSVALVAAVALFVAGFALLALLFWRLLFWLLLVFRGSCCCRSVAPVAAMALSSLAFCSRRCRSVAPVAAVALFSLNMEGHT